MKPYLAYPFALSFSLPQNPKPNSSPLLKTLPSFLFLISNPNSNVLYLYHKFISQRQEFQKTVLLQCRIVLLQCRIVSTCYKQPHEEFEVHFWAITSTSCIWFSWFLKRCVHKRMLYTSTLFTGPEINVILSRYISNSDRLFQV